MSDEIQPDPQDRQRAEAVIRAILDGFPDEPFPFHDSAPKVQAQIQWLQQVFYRKGVRTAVTPFNNTNGGPVFLWCMDFTKLSVEQARYVLPRLLVDTMRRWADEESEETWRAAMDATDIILLLDITMHWGAGNQTFIESEGHGDWLLAFDRAMRGLVEHRAAPLQGLSRSQIAAMIQWIEFVQTWPDVEYYAPDLQSALEYWTACLNRSKPEPKVKKRRL